MSIHTGIVDLEAILTNCRTKVDYLKVQYEWTCYVDNLCKNGEISEKEANNVLF